jgi:hypothetical protein
VGCVWRRILVWDVCGGGYLCGMCVEEDTCVGCVWRRILVWDVCGGGYLECVSLGGRTGAAFVVAGTACILGLFCNSIRSLLQLY